MGGEIPGRLAEAAKGRGPVPEGVSACRSLGQCLPGCPLLTAAA